MKANMRNCTRALAFVCSALAIWLFARSRGMAELSIIVGAMLTHELFHLLAAYLLRISVRGFAPALFGFRIDYEGELLSLPAATFLYGGGALGNLLLAFAVFVCSTIVFVPNAGYCVCCNLLIAFVNLLPVYPLDGGRLLEALLQKKHGLLKATAIVGSVSYFAAVVLFSLGLYVYVFYSDNFLLPLGAVLIMRAASREVEYVRMQHLLGLEAQSKKRTQSR